MAYLTIGKMNGVGKLQKNTPVTLGAGSMDNYVDVAGTIGTFGELTKDSGIRVLESGQVDWENRWTFKCWYTAAIGLELRQSSRWIINGRIFSINSYEKIGEKNFNYRFSLTEKEAVLPENIDDANVLAFLAATGITSETQKGIINDMVLGFKGADLWNGHAAIWPFMGGTGDTHKYNLFNTALYQLTYVGSPLHSAQGFKPNGTTEYADTGLIPSAVAGADQNAGSMSFYARDIGAGTTQGEMGSWDSTRISQLIIKLSGNSHGAINAATSVGSPATGTELGFFMVCRTASNVVKIYRNGIPYFTTSDVSNGLSTVPLYVNALHYNGSPVYHSNRQCAFSSYGIVGLDDAQALTYYNIVQQYQNDLNREV